MATSTTPVSFKPSATREHVIVVGADASSLERLRDQVYARGGVGDVDAAVVALAAGAGTNPELLVICLRYLHLFFGTNRDGPCGPTVACTFRARGDEGRTCPRVMLAVLISGCLEGGNPGPDEVRDLSICMGLARYAGAMIVPPEERATPELERRLRERCSSGELSGRGGLLPLYEAACACHPRSVRFRCADGREVLFERDAVERFPGPVRPPRVFEEIVETTRTNQWVAVCARTRTLYAHYETRGERVVPTRLFEQRGAARAWIRGSLRPLPKNARPPCGNDACRAPRAARRCAFCGRVAYCGRACAMADVVRHDPECNPDSTCGGCGKTRPTFFCPCAEVRYCDAACQRKDWSRHRKGCAARGGKTNAPEESRRSPAAIDPGADA